MVEHDAVMHNKMDILAKASERGIDATMAVQAGSATGSPKQRIILVSYFYDLTDTNVLCIEPLLNKMVESGYEIHVICCLPKPLLSRKADEDRGIYVYPVRPKWQQATDLIEHKLGLGKAPKMGLFQKAMRFAIRRLSSMVQSERHFHFAGFRVADQLIKDKQIANVLSVSNPMCNHQLASSIREGRDNLRWTLYQLDPYAHNLSLDDKELGKRLDLERSLLSVADRIIITDEMSRFSGGSDALMEYKDRTLVVPLPNFVIGTQPVAAIPSLFDPSKINMVYAGNIYGGFRKPEALLDIMVRLNNPNYVFHVYGWGMERLIKKYPMLGYQIVIHGRVPKLELVNALNAASILVNFGNKMENQTPSKLFDYIATGKPIVNFCYDTKDTSLYYLKRHPLYLNVFNHEVNQPEVVKSFSDFCLRSRNVSVAREVLISLYGELLSERVCSLIIKHMVR